MQTDLVLDALKQASWSRSEIDGVIHHSDRGTQYLSIRYFERLIDAGIKPSVSATGDCYDNALAETIIGLYKTEVIYRRGAISTRWSMQLWDGVDWFNNRRLMEPLGNLPPAEFETAYCRQHEESAIMV
jgi:putative transposase